MLFSKKWLKNHPKFLLLLYIILPLSFSKDPAYPIPLYTCLDLCWQQEPNARPSAKKIRNYLEKTTGLLVRKYVHYSSSLSLLFICSTPIYLFYSFSVGSSCQPRTCIIYLTHFKSVQIPTSLTLVLSLPLPFLLPPLLILLMKQSLKPPLLRLFRLLLLLLIHPTCLHCWSVWPSDKRSLLLLSCVKLLVAMTVTKL